MPTAEPSSPTRGLTVPELLVYLRDEGDDLPPASLQLVVDLTNDLVDSVAVAVTGQVPSPEPVELRTARFEVARRACANPEGWARVSIDDFSGQRPQDVARAGVYLTPTERAELVAALTGVPTTAAGHYAGSLPYRRPW